MSEQTGTSTTLVFVFGSNLAGRHGKGSAREAFDRWGARYGQGRGLQGSSYAIPTKDANLATLPLEEIGRHVAAFLDFAREHPELTFRVAAIGCGLAGYRPCQIAPMFLSAPDNCKLPPEFLRELENDGM
jgi:hypothetical protein